jgi:hypothetical protein
LQLATSSENMYELFRKKMFRELKTKRNSDATEYYSNLSKAGQEKTKILLFY